MGHAQILLCQKSEQLGSLDFFVDRCFFLLIFSTSHVRYEIVIKSLQSLINAEFIAINFDVNKFFMKLDHSMDHGVSKFRSLISAD